MLALLSDVFLIPLIRHGCSFDVIDKLRTAHARSALLICSQNVPLSCPRLFSVTLGVLETYRPLRIETKIEGRKMKDSSSLSLYKILSPSRKIQYTS